MKKDREWAFIELGKLFPNHAKMYGYSDGIMDMKCELLNKVYDVLSQLDEPEVLSQELPVIPKYIADWIEENREWYENKFFSIGRDLHDNAIHPDVGNWIIRNQEKFVKAWFGGYEVEYPLYHALIKGHEVSNFYDIYWNYDKSDDGVFVSRLHPPQDNFLNEMSKSEWNKLGINDSNADFVKVDE